MLTAYAMTLAFNDAADPAKYPQSADAYGTWKAGKLYIHLYGYNRLNTMSLTTCLGSFGNRTVLEVVDDAYSRHDSQLPGRSLPTSGTYDMRKFGLYATNVGSDYSHNSMFEHISDEVMVDLNPWYNIMIVDRSDLLSTLDAANTKEQGNYTPESWAAANLSGCIADAQAVMDAKESTQSQVDNQTALLQSAMNRLSPYLSGLRITRQPTRQGFFEGESLNLDGIIVLALYCDDTNKQAPQDALAINGFYSTAAVTKQEVTISYTENGDERSAALYVDILPTDGKKSTQAVMRWTTRIGF